ncbi:hypothetical protein EVAR_21817_1 [Eumeta japonica]|uniref:ATP-dependent DNA helicase n=1 Tax=Eumeta variegata TaxID=151549 RepID=A0A4C1S9Q7_EUMVA|nr:hypothetical protein EVAR_21817_1 [Eumeta japonica]
MILRNLNPPRLCNGTRLSVKRLMPNLIEATIINGKYAGKEMVCALDLESASLRKREQDRAKSESKKPEVVAASPSPTPKPQ